MSPLLIRRACTGSVVCTGRWAGPIGGWRTYIPSSQDEPAKLDYKEIIANAKAGHSFITTGPFLEVRTADGHGPGDTITKIQPIRLHVRVQCNTWTDIDRVAVWGWSGGGTNTLNLLFRQPDLYKVGMAVAPVPDQRLYDTIYQERYMGLPDRSPDAFRLASPLGFAEGLKGL